MMPTSNRLCLVMRTPRATSSSMSEGRLIAVSVLDRPSCESFGSKEPDCTEQFPPHRKSHLQQCHNCRADAYWTETVLFVKRRFVIFLSASIHSLSKAYISAMHDGACSAGTRSTER